MYVFCSCHENNSCSLNSSFLSNPITILHHPASILPPPKNRKSYMPDVYIKTTTKMTNNEKYLQTAIYCYSPVPSCKRREGGSWMEDLIPFLDRYLQRITVKSKLVFISPLVHWLSKLLLYFVLVACNFEQVIIFWNYFSQSDMN